MTQSNEIVKTIISVDSINKNVLNLNTFYMLSDRTIDLKEILVPKGRFYVPTPKDKIFFDKNCTVPRAKIRGFLENNKVAITRDHDKAQAIFVNLSEIKNIVETVHGYKFTAKELYDTLFALGYRGDVMVRANLLVEHDPEAIIFFNTWTGSLWNNRTSSLCTLPEQAYNDFMADRYEYIGSMKPTEYESFMYFLDNKDRLYNQDDLIKQSTTVLKMSQEQFISIKRLFESNDVDNHKIGIEILNNCSYATSAAYILLLLREFGNEILNCNTSNHVAFKALLNFFGLTRRDLQYNHYNKNSFSLDKIMSLLQTRTLLTQEAIDIIHAKAVEEIKASNPFNAFVIEKIVVSSDYTPQDAEPQAVNLSDEVEENNQILLNLE
jgi:hypothetical protein